MTNTMITITKIYIVNKTLGNNERAMNKRYLKWMGRAKKGWVLGGGFWRGVMLDKV
jgi:hypothetical protein